MLLSQCFEYNKVKHIKEESKRTSLQDFCTLRVVGGVNYSLHKCTQ